MNDRLPDIERWYVCGNCGLLGPMGDFQGECKPGWTHGVLHQVDMGSPALREPRGAVAENKRLRERVASLEVYAIGCDRALRAAGLSAAQQVPETAPASTRGECRER